MKPKIMAYGSIPEDIVEALHEKHHVAYIQRPRKDYSLFLQELEDASGLIGLGLKVDDDLLRHAPNLKVVSNISVGYDNLDLDALTRRGIMATNTQGALTETTADLVFGLMLAAARRIPELDNYVKQGFWKKSAGGELFGVDVYKKTLGIIGMGHIGMAIARRANLGFGMKILYHNRSRSIEGETKYGAVYCEKNALLKEADFICVMTPLSRQTQHFIGEKEFNLMKPSAIFINASRGKVVHEAALIEALREKRILAAGLDVYESEPLKSDSPLLAMKNVVTLPHIASATHETRYRMAKVAAENITIGLAGGRPPNLINIEVFD